MAIIIFNIPARTMKRERLALAGVPLLTRQYKLWLPTHCWVTKFVDMRDLSFFDVLSVVVVVASDIYDAFLFETGEKIGSHTIRNILCCSFVCVRYKFYRYLIIKTLWQFTHFYWLNNLLEPTKYFMKTLYLEHSNLLRSRPIKKVL